MQSQEALIQQYQKELENLGNEAVEIEREVSEIEQWLNENEAREKDLAEEVTSFTQTVALEEDRVREKELSLSESKKELAQGQEQGEQTKDFLVTKLTELTRVRNMRAGLVKLREDRQRRIIRQSEEKAQLTARLDFLNTSVLDIETRLAVQREALREFKEEIIQAQQQKIDIEKIHKTLEGEFSDLEQAWKQDQAQIRNLQEIRDNFQGYQNGVRALLKAEWPEEIKQSTTFRQVLVEGLETEPGCETAVEAALGEALQALMIQDPSFAIQGIDYLKDRGQGRATFLPLKPPVSSNKITSEPWEEKGLVPLLSKVSAQPELEDWLKVLLSPFVLVSDLRKGLEVWEKNSGLVCIVTLEGDLIDSKGIISGGSSRNPESGILFQKNLIHKLELKVGDWREKIDRKKESILTIEKDLSDRIHQFKALENGKQEKEENHPGIGETPDRLSGRNQTHAAPASVTHSGRG